MSERLLTPDEVAKLLAVSKRSVRRWTTEGRIKSIRVGRYVRYRTEDIQHVMSEGVRTNC